MNSNMRKILILVAAVGLVALAYKPILNAFVGTAGKADKLSCEYNGDVFQPGYQRRAEDGCNVCTCRETGWACTRIFCPAGGSASGTLTGTLTSPGGKMPAERVCAISLKDDKEYCQQSVEGDTSYAIPAPAGDYWVYATLIETDATRRAYYSEYERCGEKPDCKDHTPVTVTVANEQIADADPKDWAAGGQVDEINVTPSKFDYGIHNYYPGSEFIIKGEKLAGVKVFFTPWPPSSVEPTQIGDATLKNTDHGVQTWSLPIWEGFEATTVHALGTATNGDFMKSRVLRFVRPIVTASASSTIN